MAIDSMITVLALRRNNVEVARAALGVAIRAENAARGEVQATEREIDVERRRASDPHEGDALVETFAAWWPEARRRLDQARTHQDAAAAELARHRAELAASERALEMIETLLKRRREAAEADRDRREQQALDEAAGRRGMGAGPSG